MTLVDVKGKPMNQGQGDIAKVEHKPEPGPPRCPDPHIRVSLPDRVNFLLAVEAAVPNIDYGLNLLQWTLDQCPELADIVYPKMGKDAESWMQMTVTDPRCMTVKLTGRVASSAVGLGMIRQTIRVLEAERFKQTLVDFQQAMQRAMMEEAIKQQMAGRKPS